MDFEPQLTGYIIENTNQHGPFSSIVRNTGIDIAGLGPIGGQEKVSGEFLQKVALTSDLMLDLNAKGIKRGKLVKGLKKMKNISVIQRIGRGSFDKYDPILDGNYYAGWDKVNDENSSTDFIWELEPSERGQATEVVEHLHHTYTNFLLPQIFKKDFLIFSGAKNRPRKGTLRRAIDEAVDAGIFSANDYEVLREESEKAFYEVASTEYLYCLTYAMWGYIQEFTENGSLAPEWSDSHLTADSIKKDNPTGFKLYKKTVKKIISKPPSLLLKAMFGS